MANTRCDDMPTCCGVPSADPTTRKLRLAVDSRPWQFYAQGDWIIENVIHPSWRPERGWTLNKTSIKHNFGGDVTFTWCRICVPGWTLSACPIVCGNWNVGSRVKGRPWTVRSNTDAEHEKALLFCETYNGSKTNQACAHDSSFKHMVMTEMEYVHR